MDAPPIHTLIPIYNFLPLLGPISNTERGESREPIRRRSTVTDLFEIQQHQQPGERLTQTAQQQNDSKLKNVFFFVFFKVA